MSTVPFDVTGAALPAVRSAGVARLPAQARLPLPKVLLCDLDGTLIDSMPTLADLATEVIEARYGTPRILARELYLATCGLPFVKQLEEMFPDDARNPEGSAAFGSPNNGVKSGGACARAAGFKSALVLGSGDAPARGRPPRAAPSRASGPSRH